MSRLLATKIESKASKSIRASDEGRNGTFNTIYARPKCFHLSKRRMAKGLDMSNHEVFFYKILMLSLFQLASGLNIAFW